MGLARSVIENMQGTGIFAIIGFLIFFTFFLVVVIRVLRIKKEKVDEFSRLPLEEFDNEENSGSTNNKIA